MKLSVISYSLTGNNEALARSVAEKCGAEHFKISEKKPRTMGTIVFDLLLNRTPKVQPSPDVLDPCDTVLLFGPIWMGSVATPLRACLETLKKNHKKYAFISISGGADGPNPKLADELKKKTGREPFALIDLHIADLLPADPKPERKDTSEYRITKADIDKLTDAIWVKLNETIPVTADEQYRRES